MRAIITTNVRDSARLKIYDESPVTEGDGKSYLLTRTEIEHTDFIGCPVSFDGPNPTEIGSIYESSMTGNEWTVGVSLRVPVAVHIAFKKAVTCEEDAVISHDRLYQLTYGLQTAVEYVDSEQKITKKLPYFFFTRESYFPGSRIISVVKQDENVRDSSRTYVNVNN